MADKQPFITPEAGSPADTRDQNPHGKPGKPPILKPEAGSDSKPPIPVISPAAGGAVTG